MPVAVIINKRAARTPCLARARHASLFGNLGEHAVLVVIQTILAVVSDVEVFPQPVAANPAFTVTSVNVPS